MCYPSPVNRLRRWIPVVLLSGLVALAAASCMSTPTTTGPVGGRLAPCPDSPNCVCSQDTGSAAAIAPLSVSGPASEALGRIKSVVLDQPRTRLVEERPGYLRFEFRSRIFRFVDDVEFLAGAGDSAIQVRSASRTGYSDLGVNRKRIESLRAVLGRP
jgi:uncharacterized protein (DUF1499 family)